MKSPDRIWLRLSNYSKLDFLKKFDIKKTRITENGLTIETDSAKDIIERILKELERRNVKVLDIEIKKASLEDVFLKIVSDSNV